MSQAFVVDAETEALIGAEVDAGRFASAAEMIKVAVRSLVDNGELGSAEIRRLCDEGRATGIAGTVDEVFDRVEARLRAGS